MAKKTNDLDIASLNNDASAETTVTATVEKTVAPVEPVSVAPSIEDSITKTNNAMQNAAATAALKAAIDANSNVAINEAEKTYIIEKKKYMLNKCKSDEVVKFVGQKIYAQYFGPVYTFMYNTIPVTIKFDGTTQEFPRFIYNKIVEKINRVSDASIPKTVDERL